jgi:predicted anti-sigma-YlaC factor YlaD
MNCELFREQLGSYLDESLDEERRRWFRRHLHECAACRTRALAEDPSLIFAVDEATPADSARIESCVANVTAQIRQDRLARRLRPRHRPWLAAAAAMVVVVSAGLAWQSIFGDAEQPPVSMAETEVEERVATPPTVEVDMPEEDVRVYQFANDDDDADTAVYFIVNPALEL